MKTQSENDGFQIIWQERGACLLRSVERVERPRPTKVFQQCAGRPRSNSREIGGGNAKRRRILRSLLSACEGPVDRPVVRKKMAYAGGSTQDHFWDQVRRHVRRAPRRTRDVVSARHKAGSLSSHAALTRL